MGAVMSSHAWILLQSNADLAQLANEVSVEFDPAKVAQRLTDGLSSAVKAVLIERNYVDKDYRSTFYNYYAKKGQRYRPDCVRLHFFDSTVTFDSATLTLRWPGERLDDHYFGYMVLRPTGIGTIGRTVLSPDVRAGARGRIITAAHKVHVLGYRLMIEGFPSMDQHIDISVCAHAACWSILRHYSVRYSVYREYLTHDITRMAHQFNPGGLVPSKGLDVSHAERVFQEAGTFPMIVTRKNKSDTSFYRQLHAYVESGFPLFAAMHGMRHAIAIVGSELSPAAVGRPTRMRNAWDMVKSLVAVDDNHLPYLSVPATGVAADYSTDQIDAFIVAFPEKVFYPADAVDRSTNTLPKLAPILGLPSQKRTVGRYFLSTGSALRQFMRSRVSEFDPQLMLEIMELPFAQYVWIVELSTGDEWAQGQICARAVLDATASLRDPAPYWLIHSRTRALVFGRQTVGGPMTGMRVMDLKGMESTAFTRWDQNLRPIQSK